jgi:hypothetical protein
VSLPGSRFGALVHAETHGRDLEPALNLEHVNGSDASQNFGVLKTYDTRSRSRKDLPPDPQLEK